MPGPLAGPAAAPTWEELQRRGRPVDTSPAPAAAARAAPVLEEQDEPLRRSVWERFGDNFAEGANNSFVGYAVRRGADFFDWKKPEGMSEEEHDAAIVAATRAQREEWARRDEVDPSWRDDGSLLGNIGRKAVGFAGGMFGGADPTYLAAPIRVGRMGAGALGRMGQMGVIEGAADAGVQALEVQEGVADEFDPLRTAAAAAGGAVFQGGFDYAAKAIRAWRGTPAEPGSQDIGDVTLDGPDIPPGGPAPVDVDATIRSAGYDPDMFSPEVRPAMADRIIAARTRVPNVDPTTIAEQQRAADLVAAGEMDPAFAPAPPLPGAIANDVTLTAYPDGLARSDDPGGLIGMLRNQVANENVIAEAVARAADNPALQAILDADMETQAKIGPLWARLQEQMQQGAAHNAELARRGPLAVDPATELPPHLRPTIEQARGDTEGVVLPAQGRITSKFGNRAAPKAGASTNHGGIDIAGKIGDPVAAPRGGTVIAAGEAGKNGNLVRIDHGNGVITSYAHLDGFDVKIGDRVEAGQAFARVGNTGNSTGPHLHYGVTVNGQRVDPEKHKWGGEGAQEPVWRAPAPREDVFDTSGGWERQDAQRSPTDAEREAGSVYEDPSGIFRQRGGRLYESPMGTGGNERPFKDVGLDDDRPEFRNDGAGPDQPPPGSGPDGKPGPGRSYFEDINAARMDEMMREYAASQSRRRERQQRERQQRQQSGADRDPSEKYGSNAYGQKPHKDGDFWRQTDDGFVADADGKPVAFRNAREAAKWATKNEMAGDFELHTWGTNSERVTLKRRGNSTYGTKTDAPPADENVQPDGAPRAIEGPRAPEPTPADSPEPTGPVGAIETPAGPASSEPQPAAAAPRSLEELNVELADAAGGDKDKYDRLMLERESEVEAAIEAARGNAKTLREKAYVGGIAARLNMARIQRDAGESLAKSDAEKETARQRQAGQTFTRQPIKANWNNGESTQTVRTAAGREVDTEFEIRELDDVITSDDPRFDKARQPRDRGRDASDMQIAKIAKELDPEQLGANRQAAHGSPIIGPDGMVEVGNGRTMAIRRAYEEGGEAAAKYRAALESKGYFLSGWKRPVLVRRRTTELSDADMAAWVNEAQDSGTMRYSAPEQAKADAGAISDDVLELYRGGDIDSAGNRDFVKAWSTATKADANALRASDGSLSPEGMNRIRASILAKAFDDETLVAKLLGDADNNIKAIGTVLTDLAPKFAQVKAMAKAGEIPADLDISGKIGDMAALISRSRTEGKKLADLIGQKDIFAGDVDAVTEGLVRLMFKQKGDDPFGTPRAGVRIREAFDFYLEDAKAQAKGPGLFGGDEVPQLRPQDILEAARAKLDAKDGPHQAGLFKVISERERSANEQLSNRDLRRELKAKRAELEPEQRELVDRLLEAIGPDARLTYGHLGDRGPGKTIAGQADYDRNRVYVARAGDVETLLHETVHLALVKRYGEEFSELRAGDAGSSPARELIRLYNDAKARHGKYGFFNRKASGHTVDYALSSIDEFIAEALTSRKFQQWLQRGTFWERLVDGARKLVGMPARFKPLLDDAMRSGSQLLEAVVKDTRGEFTPGNVFGRKARLDKIVDADGLTRDAEKLRSIIGNPGDALAGMVRRVKDGVAWAMYSNDAKGRMVADRIESEAAHELLDHFFARPGLHDGKAVDRTFHEAVQRYAAGRSQEAFRALEGIKGEASERRVADLLRFPNRKNKATPAELEAAKELRRLFKDTIDYRKAAGEEIGEVSDGYFPRWLDVDQVLSRSDEFLQKAAKLYRDIGDDPKAAEAQAQRWLEHVVDTYAGIDAGLDLWNAAGDTVGTRTAKSREFGKAADAILADFYQNDLLPVATQYFHGAARKAEIARRFGAKGPVGSPERAKWEEAHGDKTQLQVLEDRIREDARKHGAEGAGSMGVLRSIYSSNLGRLQANMSNRQRSFVSWAHTWTQLGVMDRATITSLAELVGGFTRGGMRRGLPFVAESMKQYVRQLRNAAPDDAQRWAEAIGVANDAMVNQSLAARANIEGGTERSQKVLTGFYHATTLHQFTEGTRIAAVKMGRSLLDTWAHDLTSSSARVSTRARKYLAEVGVRDPDGFAKWVRDREFVLEDVSRETSKNAQDYATALIRVTNQTIMRPSRAEKPSWANHPVGGMFFSLMSYSYGFKKNVLDRAGRLALEGAKAKDPTLLMPAAGLALMVGFQGMMDTYVRPAVFGGGPSEDETPMEAGLRIADRGGLTGALSPIVNAITGVKYQRGLAESLAGPVIGRPLDMGTKFAALAINNSSKTNTSERNAAGAVYDNVVEPGLDGLAAARLLGVTRTAAVMGTGTRDDKGALPSDREAFVSALAGAEAKKKGD